ncbi:putative membrane protein [Secundilactobacillus oryzae JCM 18671]|uniref:Putative membrane protein n=1 Tax=Secundilactobacillus oryzae JCM 18671 TaxID=1291743 RepID=A0A081BJW6_9LACO|nr:YetF domain-containing protein [Secundilactobacillus oryzae]GAK48334.1 putative membrane protein [Secundilactobacillus oryzae JCM 18671]
MFVLIATKLAIGLAALLVVVRLLGKKSMSEITPFDLVYMLVLGGILEESVYDDTVNVGHLLFGIAVWACLIFLVEKVVQKSRAVNRLVKGEPSILVKDGIVNLKELNRNQIELEQLRELSRQHQCFSLENAKHIILENAGQVSLVVKSEEDKVLALMLVDRGQIQVPVLETHNLTTDWLKENLVNQGYQSLDDLVYVEWSEEKGFYVVTKNDVTSKVYRIDG